MPFHDTQRFEQLFCNLFERKGKQNQEEMLTFKHFGRQDKNKLAKINLPTYTCHQRREENKFSSAQILNTNSWTILTKSRFRNYANSFGYYNHLTREPNNDARC